MFFLSKGSREEGTAPSPVFNGKNCSKKQFCGAEETPRSYFGGIFADRTLTFRSLTSEEWLDSVQAAAYLKVSVGALRNMTSNGQLPYYKLGRRNRYSTEDLRKLLLSQRKGVSNGN